MDGQIRKVIVGNDMKTGMCFVLGHIFDRVGEVVDIAIDNEFLEQYGVVTVIIQVANSDNVIETWKRFPIGICVLEYHLT